VIVIENIDKCRNKVARTSEQHVHI